MAKFSSEFKNLGFYIEGKIKQFSNGEFHTDDLKEIEVLEKLAGVVAVLEETVEEVSENVKEIVDDVTEAIEEIEEIVKAKPKAKKPSPKQ